MVLDPAAQNPPHRERRRTRVAGLTRGVGLERGIGRVPGLSFSVYLSVYLGLSVLYIYVYTYD